MNKHFYYYYTEGIKSENEVFQSSKSMEINKSPGNDGVSKEFYEGLWDAVFQKAVFSLYS